MTTILTPGWAWVGVVCVLAVCGVDHPGERASRSGDSPSCEPWDAAYSVEPVERHESVALVHTWRAVGDCSTFTFQHYRVCHYDAPAGEPPAAAPATPSSEGATCFEAGSSATDTSSVARVNRSDRAYFARIFACQDEGCTAWYGDGTHGHAAVTDDADLERTARERWVLEGVADYDDADRAVSDGHANASAAIFYPSGFDDAGYLGLWWSTTNEHESRDEIWYKRAAMPGWQAFNETTWTAPTLVGQQADSGAYADTTHPWVVPVDDASGRYIRMFVQLGVAPDLSIHSVDSLDEAGTDFGLTCTSEACAIARGTCACGDPCDWSVAQEEICQDADSADCFYLGTSGHGRVAWDYGEDGALDFAEDRPAMLISGDKHDLCAGGLAPDDIYQADWDGTAWVVPVAWDERNARYCPEHTDPRGHDPAILPLPADGFKAYWMAPDGSSAQIHYVCYTDDLVTWEDCAEIELAFDDGTRLGAQDTSLWDCVGNMDAVSLPGRLASMEGAFFQSSRGPACFGPGGGGIVFAEHRN